MTFSPLHMRRHLCAGLRTLLASLAALVVLAGAVASVALAAAPRPAPPTGRPCTPATSRPEHPAVARHLLRLRHPELRDAQPDRSTSRSPPRATGSIGASRAVSMRCPRSARGPSREHVGAQCRAQRRGQRLRHVLHGDGDPDRRPVHRRGDVLLPEGPYTDTSTQPMVCQNGVGYSDPTVDSTGDFGGSIDPDIFTDSSGNNWLIWKNDGNHMNPPVPTTPLVRPAQVRLHAHGQRPTDAAPERRRGVAERHHRGSRHGRDLDDVGQHDDGQLHPLLFRQRRGRVHLCHRLGQLPLRSRRRLHRPVDVRTAAHHVLGHVRPRRPRRLRPARVGTASPQLVMAFAAWQGSTIGYLACGFRPMYLADLSFEPNSSDPPVPGSRRPTPTRQPRPARLPAWRRSRRLDTGKSAPTAASSASAPPSSTARPAPCTSTSPWSAWRRRPTATATGSWPATAACSPTATRSSTARRAASRSTNRSSA